MGWGDNRGLKTQMGTNLLNLFPSFLDKRTCRGARLRLLRLAIGIQRCLRFASCSSDPDLSLQPFTTVTSGSPFEILADPFRERSCPKSLRLFHLAMDVLSGYFHCLATGDFHRKLPATCVTFRLTLQTSTT